jgi:alkaline phosphatase D
MGWTRREFIKAGTLGFGALATRGFAEGISASPDTPVADFTRFALGSCLLESSAANVLDVVVAAKPQAFVWLGDNIYGDTRDMTLLKSRYQALGDNPRFKALKAACPQLATWDDHDYGENNAGSEYPQKIASQKIFQDFWGVPANDPRRSRPGIYDSRVFGTGARTVQFIMLDGRYHRTASKEDPNGTMLGTDQWKWLADQLKIPASVRVVCSGIQVVPDEHGFEGWYEFPKERQRLYDLIKSTRTPGVVFVSGDQHWAELSKAPDVLGYPAYDLTASSLDRTYPLPVNGKRVGAATPDANFGFVEIEWDGATPAIRFQIRSAVDGKFVLNHVVPLADLKVTGVGLAKRANPRPGNGESPRFRGRTVSGRRLEP